MILNKGGLFIRITFIKKLSGDWWKTIQGEKNWRQETSKDLRKSRGDHLGQMGMRVSG